MLAAYQGPTICIPKVETSGAEPVRCLPPLLRGCAQGIPPQPGADRSPFMLLWPVYLPQRGQSTGRDLNPTFEAENAADLQGPGRMWGAVMGGSSANQCKPQRRNKKFLLLESYFETKLTLEKHSETL